MIPSSCPLHSIFVLVRLRPVQHSADHLQAVRKGSFASIGPPACIQKRSAMQVDKLCETKGLDYIDREKAK